VQLECCTHASDYLVATVVPINGRGQ